jgi:hypothetical protein
MLSQCRTAALSLADWLTADARFELVQPPELDIVVWAVKARSFTDSSDSARALFDAAAAQDLHLALIEMARGRLPGSLRAMRNDRETLLCLRSCLMKPEHADWVAEICARLDAACATVLPSAE